MTEQTWAERQTMSPAERQRIVLERVVENLRCGDLGAVLDYIGMDTALDHYHELHVARWLRGKGWRVGFTAAMRERMPEILRQIANHPLAKAGEKEVS